MVLHFGAGAAREASAFRFHPGQTVEEHGDGSLTMRFRADGIDEMCRGLFARGLASPSKDPSGFAAMCASLAAHHAASHFIIDRLPPFQAYPKKSPSQGMIPRI